MSLLLIVGGDVIRCAIAQQAGDRFPTPIAFSFGWVAYSFTALLTAVGGHHLTPTPEDPSIVINTASGHVRNNQSWILARMLRDFRGHWIDKSASDALKNILRRAKRPKAGLCISIYEASADFPAGTPQRDWLWYSGYLVTFTQLCVAIIPWVTTSNWAVFAVTAAGNVLSYTTSSLPQWRYERWSARPNSTKTYVLTYGNGAQHALVVKSAGRGLNLEDLAGALDAHEMGIGTRLFAALLLCLWIVLLITTSGLEKGQTWYLLLIGSIGMLHSIVVAGAQRRPEAFGLPLTFQKVICDASVMQTLMLAERDTPGLGRSMRSTFFSGDLREPEQIWWDEMKKTERNRSLVLEGKVEGSHVA